MSVYYLSYQTVCLINVAYCGDGAGVNNAIGVAGIVDRPADTFDSVELFPGLFEKAAALLEGFSTTQFFSDGNKRTSFLSATVFLACNGYDWYGPDVDDAEDYLLEVAANKHSIPGIAQWLRDYSKPQ